VDRLADLSAAGVAVWLDDISRGRLVGGGLDALCRGQHVVGVTSNPTIFAKALADSDDYADQIDDLALRGVGLEEATRMITTYDVRWACDVVRPAYDASAGLDGVSIEVDPRLAHDTDKTILQAIELWKIVDRPNLLIKIPATLAGLPAITAVAGVIGQRHTDLRPDRYSGVMDASWRARAAKANGHNLATIASVASFFVSRVDTEVDKRLERLGTEQATAMLGKAAVANAQLAYQRYEKAFATDRWQALAAAGARPQRPLWASTSTKNPDYRDVVYVEELVAPGVVNTMPEPVIHAFADHGEVKTGVVHASFPQAQQVMDRLAELGIDIDDVTDTLEREGVEKFEASWIELLKTVETQLGESSR
jgi:transaldolase